MKNWRKSLIKCLKLFGVLNVYYGVKISPDICNKTDQ